MTQKNHTANRDRDGELKFYLPAGVSPLDISQFRRIWGTLFGNRAEPPE